MNEFDAMNEVEVPDQWDDIARRADDVAIDLELDEPRGRSRWLPGGAIAAGVLVVALVAALVAVDGSNDGTVTLDADPRMSGPVLSCPDGELAAGSIPDDAVFGSEPLYTASLVEGIVSWSWEVGDQTVQLNVRGIPWADEGQPTEVITQPQGVLVTLPHGLRFTGPTGLSESLGCGTYDVMVAGGSEEQNRQAALDTAGSLTWVPVDAPEYPDFTDEDSVRRWAVAHAPPVVGIRPPPIGGKYLASGRIELFQVDVDSMGPSGEKPMSEWFGVAPSAVVWAPLIRLDDGHEFVVDGYAGAVAGLTFTSDPPRLEMYPGETTVDDEPAELETTPIVIAGR